MESPFREVSFPWRAPRRLSHAQSDHGGKKDNIRSFRFVDQ
jgi:hypothetical protein